MLSCLKGLLVINVLMLIILILIFGVLTLWIKAEGIDQKVLKMIRESKKIREQFRATP